MTSTRKSNAGTPRPRRRTTTGRTRRSVVASAEPQRPDRRKDILLSAEALFAERGYAAVSVRDIAARAGVPVALVGYYFGRKQELFDTVFEHRRAYIAERIERIRAVDCSPTNHNAVEELVRAWAEPVIRLRASDSGEAFSLLVARTAWDPGPEATGIIERFYDPLALAFVDAMAEALPGCPRARILWGYEYALGSLLMYVADKRVERLSGGELASADPALCDDFVRFVGAGFRAFCSA
ncbi:TetR/AcrR family transcriptional regulator [Chelatococcus sp. SYSU_G07232]|uniref:TetR/AcrR family transcriptional regulator n=1 Tax=Chelatococcus albus TaxID=3047466 RepID=A0ABT7ADS5_9HYPH|nr:TetR/AcrR family transcriptional regulator [Chelatococcus sp. SYSU_G07232]MDJ1157530.1 TetR/AcrR family transcriptional regulator [Chelatococcus sp. SYSU_G07232]